MGSIVRSTNRTKATREQIGLHHEANDARREAFPRHQPGLLAVFQGIYYVATGLWAIVDLDSFEAVTGPKTDGWLVKTVGALVTTIGAVLIMAGLRRRISAETVTLAVGSAGGLAAIDIPYAVKGRISPVYLLDAIAQVFIMALWCRSLRQRDADNRMTVPDNFQI